MVERICTNCGSTKAIENHHISYKPPITVFLCRRCHQEIHDNQPIEGQLTEIMRQYRLYTKLGVQLKNWGKSWNKQFDRLNDESMFVFLDQIKDKQKNLLREAKYELGDKVKLCEKWKGIGIRYLAYLFAFVNPNRFSSLRKFLYYCGRKESSRITNKYSRIASSTAYQISVSLIRSKDPIYYPPYLEIKASFNDERPIIKHKKALNRISTLWLKDFYKTQNLNIS